MAFVLFKGMVEKSSTWASHFWYNFTGGYRKATDPGSASKGQMKQPVYPQSNYDPKLPQVPKATVTGLRSFIDKFGHSKAEKAHTNSYTDDMNLTVISMDYDYHAQLRAGSMDRRP